MSTTEVSGLTSVFIRYRKILSFLLHNIHCTSYSKKIRGIKWIVATCVFRYEAPEALFKQGGSSWGAICGERDAVFWRSEAGLLQLWHSQRTSPQPNFQRPEPRQPHGQRVLGHVWAEISSRRQEKPARLLRSARTEGTISSPTVRKYHFWCLYPILSPNQRGGKK